MRRLVDSDNGTLRKERVRRKTSLCVIDAVGEGMRLLDDFVDDVDLPVEVEEEMGRVVAIAK